MGTASEWIRVLEAGAAFGALMLLLDAITIGRSFARWANLIATAVASLGFGMMWVFEWRVLHGGVAIIFIVALACAIAAGFANRRAIRKAEVPKEH